MKQKGYWSSSTKDWRSWRQPHLVVTEVAVERRTNIQPLIDHRNFKYLLLWYLL
jgi:hypothetical protein